jgi:hypothetical protein
MHNGGIAEFPLIKRRLQTGLPDVAFDMVQGNTGSYCAYIQDVLTAEYRVALLRFGMGFRTIFVQGTCDSSSSHGLQRRRHCFFSFRTLMRSRLLQKSCAKLCLKQ